MSKRTMYFSLILVFMLLVFGAWMLAFFGVTVPTGRIAVNSGPGETKPALSASGVFFNPPSPEEAPESIRAEVILGYKIMTE
ncbi:MAG: cytochrome C, partial [Deltaproteobacteria bacterium]|nr:cytochrome C [Deltaproteobacteria bacterium]